MEIRPGEPRDLEAIAAIQAASHEAAAWPAADYLVCDLLVAATDDRVIAFVATRRTAPEEIEILNLAVSPAFRRRGVARALVEALLSSTAGDVFLEVRPSNHAARELYKSLGFQEFTLRPDYYTDPPEPAIVMKFHSC